MTDKRFCELDSTFCGEEIDNVKQLTKICFTGAELKEYIEFFVSEETKKLMLLLKKLYEDKHEPDKLYIYWPEVKKALKDGE